MNEGTEKVRINWWVRPDTLETLYRLSARLGVGKGEVIDYLAQWAKETMIDGKVV